jgi:hypothetical protein
MFHIEDAVNPHRHGQPLTVLQLSQMFGESKSCIEDQIRRHRRTGAGRAGFNNRSYPLWIHRTGGLVVATDNLELIVPAYLTGAKWVASRSATLNAHLDRSIEMAVQQGDHALARELRRRRKSMRNAEKSARRSI